MTQRFQAWYRERSLREQRLLLLMFALLAVTLLWLGIYLPVQDALSVQRRTNVLLVATGVVGLGTGVLGALFTNWSGSPKRSTPEVILLKGT